MKLPKLARFLGLSLIVAAVTLPVSAARLCSCEFCQRVPSHVPCNNLEGRTTCGNFLIAASCPAE